MWASRRGKYVSMDFQLLCVLCVGIKPASCSDAHRWIGTVVFNHGPRRLQLPSPTEQHSSWLNWSALWSAPEGKNSSVKSSAEVGLLHFHEWWLTTTFNILQQVYEITAYQLRMGWICVKATWHKMIRFRQSEDIYIQRQLSPWFGKWGGQPSSSTSIHYGSIKKSNEDRRTHRHLNCHTGKPAVVQKCTYCWIIKRFFWANHCLADLIYCINYWPFNIWFI